MLTGPRLDGKPFPMIGNLVDVREMPVYVKVGRSNQGMWTLLGRSLRPVVKIPGLTRVAVLWESKPGLDYEPI
jgi:hypothetical protein